MNKNVYIIGVSGGADSMCLLHKMMQKIPYKARNDGQGKIIVAHLNHGLREAADSDEKFVGDFASENQVLFVSRKENVAKYARKNKVSIETAGRILRYKFFADIAQDYEGATVLTAHNKNDSVESFMMHLLRGAALSGLCGIREKCKAEVLDGREIMLERPLVGMSRAEIEEYNHENDVPYIYDESNSDLKYERNRVRHEIMPFLMENGGLDKISDAILRFQVDNDYLERCVYIPTNADDTIDIYRFNSLHLAIKRRIIHRLAKKFTNETISEERIDEVIRAIAKNHGGKVIQLPGGVRVKIDKGKVDINKK